MTEEGGYDKVSDTKGNKLAWRRVAGEFLPGSSNLTTQAFLVKSAYYKNLTYASRCIEPMAMLICDQSLRDHDISQA